MTMMRSKVSECVANGIETENCKFGECEYPSVWGWGSLKMIMTMRSQVGAWLGLKTKSNNAMRSKVNDNDDEKQGE